MVRPLELIYRCLSNPAPNLFSFSDIEGKEVVVLDDFRLSPSNQGRPVEWQHFLVLCDGGTCHFSRPHTAFAEDVTIPSSNAIPIFCTGKGLPVYLLNGEIDGTETEMMRVRFKVYTFTHCIPVDAAKPCAPCARCFVDLLYSHAAQLAGLPVDPAL